MTFSSRLMAGILVPLAIGGTLASCGNDNDGADGSATTSGGGARTTPKLAASAAEVDKAFVRQMVPHHEMAVEMAEMAQKSGEHDEIKQLADDVISAQTKEIADLQAIAKDLGVTPDKPMSSAMDHADLTGDATTLGLSMDQMGMSMNMSSLESADPFDKAFIDQMTVHHQGAVAMAKAQLAGGENPELEKIARAIVSAQEKEIAELAQWRADWYPGDDDSGEHMPGMRDDMPGMNRDMPGMNH